MNEPGKEQYRQKEHTMKKISFVLCVAVSVLLLFASAHSEGKPASGMRIYGAGTYTVGTNFVKGEYILFCSSSQEGTFIVSIDEEGNDVISEASFRGNAILTVEDGDYLQLINCTAASSEDYYSRYKIELDSSGGMLKVGKDIEPGVYELLAKEDKNPIYRVYDDSRYYFVAEEGTFQTARVVRLSQGQYLELNDCYLGEMVPEARLADNASLPQVPPPPPGSLPDTQPPRPSSSSSSPAPLPQESPKPPETAANAEPPKPKETSAPKNEQKETPKEQGQGNGGEGAAKAQADQNMPKEETPQSTAQKVRINRSKTPVIRSIPSTKGEKLGAAEAGAEYELLDTEGKWYKIRLADGKEGWITSSMAEIVE